MAWYNTGHQRAPITSVETSCQSIRAKRPACAFWQQLPAEAHNAFGGGKGSRTGTGLSLAKRSSPRATPPVPMRLADMKHTYMRQLYRSPNGDTWFLVRDPATAAAFVRHEANVPSGGQVTDIEIGAFLYGPRSPEHEALLRLIGNSILGTRRADTEDDQSAVNTAKEWSDAELIELGNMLIGGVSIAEMARRLRRDHGDVQDKVVEVGSAFGSGSAARMSVSAKVSEDWKSSGDWRVEKSDDDGGSEVAVFAGPNARQRAIEYADWRYRDFEEVSLAPMPNAEVGSQQ
jgi:hypothetical protein